MTSEKQSKSKLLGVYSEEIESQQRVTLASYVRELVKKQEYLYVCET